MSLLDTLKSKVFGGPKGPPPGTIAVRAMSAPTGPPDLSRGIPSATISPPPGLSRQTGISQLSPIPSIEPTRTPFSPAAEISEALSMQPQMPQTEIAPSKDVVRMVERIEDRIDIINEKIDLILRELKNVYTIMKK